MIILTCGHTVEDFDDVVHASIKGWTREHTPCVDYVTYCVACWSEALQRGDVLLSHDEEMEWLENNDD